MTKSEIRAAVRMRRQPDASTTATDTCPHRRIGVPPITRQPDTSTAATATALLSHLQEIREWHTARRPCIYLSLPDEAPTNAIVENCFQRRLTVLAPCVMGNQLLLRTITAADTLRRGTFGILEPPETAPLADITECDIVVVPGMAFDPAGHRIGRGKGFYDRLLANALPSRTTLVALAFEHQLFPQVPTEPHDIRMDYIVTPERLLRCH